MPVADDFDDEEETGGDICPHCGGTGRCGNGDTAFDCPECGGTGFEW